jgi:hypothetical protein
MAFKAAPILECRKEGETNGLLYFLASELFAFQAWERVGDDLRYEFILVIDHKFSLQIE